MLSRAEAVIAALEGARPALLDALGQAAVAAVQDVMLTGYAQPVWETGALYHNVQHQVQGDRVIIRSTLPYAGFVHGGTSRMPPRPYLAHGVRLLVESGAAQAVLQEKLLY